MQHGELPPGVTVQRTTDDFDAESVPNGLLRAHQLGAGAWGLLEVLAGSLTFVWEDGAAPPLQLSEGDSLVIPPEVRHHVEPGPDARFHVVFHR